MPPRDNRRADRVAEAIREEVARFLTEDARDPRLAGVLVTVTAVDVTRDLRHAAVFVSLLPTGDDTSAFDPAPCMEALAAFAPRLRGPVGRALRLRVAPEFTFRLDRSVAHAARIETLLASVRPPVAPADPGAPPAPEDGTPPGADD